MFGFPLMYFLGVGKKHFETFPDDTNSNNNGDFVEQYSTNNRNPVGSENNKRWLGWKWVAI